MNFGPPDQTGGCTGLRVLLVDDHADERALYSIVLRSLGADVAFAEGWGAARRAIAEAPPDLVVSATPVIRGRLGFTRRVRTALAAGRARNPSMRALAVTPHARARDRGRVLALGFDEHLPKPCEIERFAAVVRSLSRRAA